MTPFIPPSPAKVAATRLSSLFLLTPRTWYETPVASDIQRS